MGSAYIFLIMNLYHERVTMTSLVDKSVNWYDYNELLVCEECVIN